jgi:NAD(P)-dependent dehydrogenase (short-subunit alcohol dehydrogenase family)
MEIHNYKSKVAIITGGSGVLGFAMAKGMAVKGVKVALLGRTEETIQHKVEEINALGGKAIGIKTNVLELKELETAKDYILSTWGKIDILINAAGGNIKGATIMPEANFFDLDINSFDAVTDLNLKGSLLPILVFGKEIAKQPNGSIINISSIAAQQVLTRVFGYSVSKSAIENLTKWLAVEMAKKSSNNLRVNAISPGFFIGKQNESLLLNTDGSFTERGKTIINNTPMKRFGKPEELVSTVLWLIDDSSSFITGQVIHIDGGFSAFSGV